MGYSRVLGQTLPERDMSSRSWKHLLFLSRVGSSVRQENGICSRSWLQACLASDVCVLGASSHSSHITIDNAEQLINP